MVLRSVHGDQHIGQMLAKFGSVSFQNSIRTVVERLFIAFGLLEIHQIDLMVGNTTSRYCGMPVKEQTGAG